MTAPRRIPWWVAAPSLAALGACSTQDTPCSAPGSGTFMMTLKYSQTIPVSTYCASPEAGPAGDAAASDAAVTEASASDASVSDAPSSDAARDANPIDAAMPADADLTEAGP